MEIFIMTAQPNTCPLCGARAEIIDEFDMDELLSQLCECSNLKCRYVFIEQEDEPWEKTKDEY